MTQDTPVYDIHAVRYGEHAERRSAENFLGGDLHDAPMPLVFYLWAVVGAGKTYILDTGFDQKTAVKRNRTFSLDPREGLRRIGVEADKVEDVIISHMHYDHAGNHDLFPNARFHIQDREMAYCTGRCMTHLALGQAFEAEDVVAMVRRVFSGRVQFYDGDGQIAPGLSVHRIGGHTAGLQVLRVWTRRGWVVLASDSTHFYANFQQQRPFPIVMNTVEMLEGYGILKRLASSPDHIIPGHDPLVLKRYPAPRKDLEGIVARLDVAPAGG